MKLTLPNEQHGQGTVTDVLWLVNGRGNLISRDRKSGGGRGSGRKKNFQEGVAE